MQQIMDSHQGQERADGVVNFHGSQGTAQDIQGNIPLVPRQQIMSSYDAAIAEYEMNDDSNNVHAYDQPSTEQPPHLVDLTEPLGAYPKHHAKTKKQTENKKQPEILPFTEDGQVGPGSYDPLISLVKKKPPTCGWSNCKT